MRRNSFTIFQVHAIHMAFRGCGIDVSGVMLLVVEGGVLYCYDLILAKQKALNDLAKQKVLDDASSVTEEAEETKESELARHRIGAAQNCLMALVRSFCGINNHEHIGEVQFVHSREAIPSPEDVPDSSSHRLEVVA